jgi:hypothetical protein
VRDEVEHYLEEATAAGVARGLTPDQARRAARLELGSPTAVRLEVRAYGWEHLVGTLFADRPLRRPPLRRSPGFTLITVTTPGAGHRRPLPRSSAR